MWQDIALMLYSPRLMLFVVLRETIDQPMFRYLLGASSIAPSQIYPPTSSSILVDQRSPNSFLQ